MKNAKAGDQHELVQRWWRELDPTNLKAVEKSAFLSFMYKKGFVMDMVELDVLHKGLLGESFVQDKEPVYKSQFDKLFLKAILYGAL